MNRIIMEKVQSMINESGLPKAFWAEAASTSVYLINKSPSTTINFKISDEVWYASELDYSYLKRFGCIAYVYADDGKLNPRDKKRIFLGYLAGVKSYKVWLIDEIKCVVS